MLSELRVNIEPVQVSFMWKTHWSHNHKSEPVLCRQLLEHCENSEESGESVQSRYTSEVNLLRVSLLERERVAKSGICG
ncbi:hypothetical protein JOB18_033143 [Solea senegalensis]|uniref:Uncharacterized protein n=1 Tax=Solea senegalensis TaxID=28829 RepID=A0AAV6Q5U5_SOLSE|nr:hypothetical protein JOB18_033143 [Solea senegalensis]